MLKTGIFDRAHLATLKRAVDVYARRHGVTSQNIANVHSPDYGAREVKFEDLLARRGELSGYRTHPDHIPLGRRGIDETRPEVVAADTNYDNGVNNVDIDAEMADLATNDLSYRLATRLLSQRYSVLRGAIKGQIR